jgi:4-diphosphocytidyl-2-C-methyl-D-erythritol kinase
MAPLSEFAPAKVNLYLHVVGRRADGYHLLDSLAVFPAIGDVLRAEPDDGFSLVVEGPFGGGLMAEPDNLVLRAGRALASAAGIVPRARVALEKRLPVASGIGGGSADAAAALRLLVRLWAIDVPAADLHAIAAGLGADVPVCLASVPARMGGVGEVLSPAPALPAFGMALVNPGVAVSTPAVFRARSGRMSAAAALPEFWDGAASMAAALAALSNDLEPAARTLQPEVGEALAALSAAEGCLLARMSGSGATCFGLFADATAAEAAAAALRRPGWWAAA